MEIEWKSNFGKLKRAARLRYEDILALGGVSIHVQQKLKRGENVNLKSLLGACLALDCTLDDLIVFNRNGDEESESEAREFLDFRFYNSQSD